MTWDEDRCRIRTGYGPENTSRLRRFAISVLNLHAKPGDSVTCPTGSKSRCTPTPTTSPMRP
jgi:hypothetical protein